MLSFKNVSYSIGNKKIINNFSFSFYDGEKILIMGPSGCGKSTLLNLILKNITPTSGSIYYDKEDIFKFNERETNEYLKNKVYLIFQKDDLFDNLTVFKNLSLFYENKEVNKLLEKANLLYLKDNKVSDLSGGERQRIAIIKACLANSEILLCDEITSSLDSKNAIKMLAFILKMFPSKLIIFISHDEKVYQDFIDVKLTFKDGKIQEDRYNNVNNNFNKKTKKRMKDTLKLTLINGLKKFSIFSLLIMFLASISFYVEFNFQDIFMSFAIKSYQKYFNYDVLKIVNNTDILPNGKDILYDYSTILNNSYVYVNDYRLVSFSFEPYSSNNEKVIVISKDLLVENEIIDLKKIEIKNDEFIFNTENIEIVKENNLFSKPAIYYDVNYFNKNYKIKTNDLVIINYDFTNLDARFTNNPLYEDLKEDKPYLTNNAYYDYLTYQMVFKAIKKITSYFFMVIIIFTFFITFILESSKILKDINKIAIYKVHGFSYLELYLSYAISPLLSFIILLPLILINYKFIYALLVSLLVLLISLFVSFKYLSFKALRDLLNEETY